MSEISSDLLYTSDHEWVMVEDTVATIGITDHAQSELGDITFVELPMDDTPFNSGDEACTIESVKAASAVFAPLSGSVIEVNSELEDEPGAINSDPYGAGWIFKLDITDTSEVDKLMSPEEYETFLMEESGN